MSAPLGGHGRNPDGPRSHRPGQLSPSGAERVKAQVPPKPSLSPKSLPLGFKGLESSGGKAEASGQSVGAGRGPDWVCTEDTQKGWGMARARPPARPLPLPSLEFPEAGEVWLFRRVISSRLQRLEERERECVCVEGGRVRGRERDRGRQCKRENETNWVPESAGGWR